MKAFPWGGNHDIDGMDMRDYFAAKASEADIQQHQWEVQPNTGYVLVKRQIKTREEARYSYADAMMKARAQ